MYLLPIVSIGMPVFNGEPFIREALDSLLAQTFTDFELIISDNASTDNTERICREYCSKDKRIRYVRWPENRGGFKNFKFVLDEAAGKYFMWAAADDAWNIDWIKILTESISHEDVCVISNCQFSNESQSIQPRSYKKFRHAWFYLDHWRTGKCMYIYGLFHTSTIRNLNINILSTSNSGDWLFLLSSLGAGNLTYTPGATVYYRIHEHSVSSTQEKNSGYASLLLRYLHLKTIIAIYQNNPVLKAMTIIALTPIKIFAELVIDINRKLREALKY